MNTSQLIQTATAFDNGDLAVTMDQYDDAMDQLVELAEDGDEAAERFMSELESDR